MHSPPWNNLWVSDPPPFAARVVDTRLAMTRNGQQLWIHGKLWNPSRVAGRILVDILVDTGAGGGNYVSLEFWRSI